MNNFEMGFVKTVTILVMVFGMMIIMFGGFLLGMNIAKAVMEYSGSTQRIYIAGTFTLVTTMELIGTYLFTLGDDALSCLKKES